MSLGEGAVVLILDVARSNGTRTRWTVPRTVAGYAPLWGAPGKTTFYERGLFTVSASPAARASTSMKYCFTSCSAATIACLALFGEEDYSSYLHWLRQKGDRPLQ